MKKLILFGILFSYLATFAAEGTEGGGGGQTRSSKPASKDDIVESIMLARKYGTYYLTDAYNRCVRDNYGSSTRCNLVRGGLESTLSKFHSTAIKIEKDKACKVQLPNGRTRNEEASADVATNSMCFSLMKIAQRKHSEREIFIKMFSLYMHEFNHLQGYGVDRASEARLREFQDDLEYRNYRAIPEDLMNGLLIVHSSLNGILAGWDYTGDLDEVSLNLIRFPGQSNRDQELSVMKFEESREMEALSRVLTPNDTIEMPQGVANEFKQLQELARKIQARVNRADSAYYACQDPECVRVRQIDWPEDLEP